MSVNVSKKNSNIMNVFFIIIKLIISPHNMTIFVHSKYYNISNVICGEVYQIML